MLYLQGLPSYTTERYYLLSEVEQAATFDFNFEALRTEGQEGPGEEEDEGLKFFYYIIWDAGGGLEAFKKDAEKLFGAIGSKRSAGRRGKRHEEEDEDDEQFFRRAQYFVAVEVLAPREMQVELEAAVRLDMKETGDRRGQAAAQHDIAKAHSWIWETYPHLDFIAFGTCDTVAGTPALEVLQQIVCFAYRSIDPSRKMVRVADRVALLGHDSSREPDAESDVTQALYMSRPFSPPKTKESRIDFDVINGPLLNAVAVGGILAALCAILMVSFSQTNLLSGVF